MWLWSTDTPPNPHTETPHPHRLPLVTVLGLDPGEVASSRRAEIKMRRYNRRGRDGGSSSGCEKLLWWRNGGTAGGGGWGASVNLHTLGRKKADRHDAKQPASRPQMAACQGVVSLRLLFLHRSETNTAANLVSLIPPESGGSLWFWNSSDQIWHHHLRGHRDCNGSEDTFNPGNCHKGPNAGIQVQTSQK